MTSIKLQPPATLSPSLQGIARHYLAAQQRSGEALLEAARWLAEARKKAQHGEWGIFLQATRTSEGTAKRLLDIHAAAEADPQFADAVRSNWLTATAAAELAQPSTPPDLRQRLLAASEAPTRADVKAARTAIPADVRADAIALAEVYMQESPATAAPALTINGVPRPHPMAGLPPPPGLERLKSATVAEMAPTPGVYFWGQIPDAIESHQWRWVAPGRWESRCEKITTHDPGAGTDTGTGRRCLTCATRASAVYCEETGCEEFAVGSPQNIAGLKIPRCLRHTEEARAQQRYDEEVAEMRRVGEWAERLGAIVDYLSRDAHGRVKVIPPAGYQQAEIRCNAAELADLCVAWEGHARGGGQQEAATGINWHKVDTLALNLGTARDAGRALDRWIALGQELLPASPDPRADAARLLQMLAPLLRAYRTEHIGDLAAAIEALNECEEGTEAEYTIRVLWALLDLESES